MADEVWKQEGDKSWILTFLFCAFFGPLGIHRFYTGYIGIGILQVLTAGGCGLWVLIDYLSILLNKFNDADGNCLAEFNQTVASIFLTIFVIGIIVSLCFLIFGILSA